ncbi:MAG TPA: nucleoside hydrolase [Acidobacteriota bacterium]|nr:nucleoside hydrolase [Acidobacteriota bacterium]
MKTQLLQMMLCLGLALFTQAFDCPTAKPGGVPVILDTDIGDDIDDTWALALLLKSPELDLKLVVTDQGKSEYRAKIVARLLEIAGRTDVGIGLGLPVMEGEGGQAAWVKDYEISRYPGRVFRDGVQALINTIMQSPERVTLICIGPVPNIQAALEREPRIAQRARFVGMHGSVRYGYGGKSRPEAEYNVKANAQACRRALSAAWDVTITPLDTCSLVRLIGDQYAAVRDCRDPLAQAVIENYRFWLGKDRGRAEKESSTLFDPVAVYLAISEDLLVMEKLGIRITDDGFTVIDSKAKLMKCATSWKNLPAFREFLVKRLTGQDK